MSIGLNSSKPSSNTSAITELCENTAWFLIYVFMKYVCVEKNHWSFYFSGQNESYKLWLIFRTVVRVISCVTCVSRIKEHSGNTDQTCCPVFLVVHSNGTRNLFSDLIFMCSFAFLFWLLSINNRPFACLLFLFLSLPPSPFLFRFLGG